MSLANKLQSKGASMRILHAPDGIDLGGVATNDAAEATVCFVVMAADLAHAGPVCEAARADHLAWIAYPKTKKLGTDVNRDTLHAAVQDQGVLGVRMISIDDTWSALRVRPVPA